MRSVHLRTLVFPLLFAIVPTVAQELPVQNEFVPLLTDITRNKNLDTISRVVAEAEKKFKVSRKAFETDPARLALLTYRYGLFRKAALKELQEPEVFTDALTTKRLPAFMRLMEDSSDEVERALEEGISLYKNPALSDGEQLASLKFELADFYLSSRLRSGELSDWDVYMKRGVRIQELLSDSYTIRRKLYGENNGRVLVSLGHLANSYLLTGDFEKSLELHEEFVSAMSERYGEETEGIVYALQVIAAIKGMIGRVDEAELIAQRVSKISSEPWDFRTTLLEISPRAGSFGYRGLAKIGLTMRSGTQTGIRVNGSGVEEAVLDNSDAFRMRSDLRDPQYSMLSPGRTKPTFSFAKVVEAVVTVNENGEVVEVTAETEDAKARKKVEKEVRGWKFRPFLHNGVPMKMTGIVYYYFR